MPNPNDTLNLDTAEIKTNFEGVEDKLEIPTIIIEENKEHHQYDQLLEIERNYSIQKELDENIQLIINLIGSRRYDLLLNHIRLFSSISLTQLDEFKLVKELSACDLLFQESSVLTMIKILNERTINNFSNENDENNIKILEYLLSVDDKYISKEEKLISLFGITSVFYENKSIDKLFNILNSYITTNNIFNYVELLSHVLFNYPEQQSKTVELLNNSVYDCNTLIKLLTALDCDNHDHKPIKKFITTLLKSYNVNVNVIDKNGNTILSNCIEQYSVKKIMYLVKLGCNPMIKNPVTGINLITEISNLIKELKKENNMDSVYYYYKLVKNYFNMHNYKNVVANNNLNQVENQSTFKWFLDNFCKK